MPLPDDLRRRLSAAQQEALRVGDSPQRADQLAATVAELARAVAAADASDELRNRLRAALADAERVLRRDDDGREAARHLQTALRLAEDRPRPPSPF
ncbi:MAG TPA: hypothetical protein VFX98_09005 [Longimicrobiaceae bacterium]|nr:hypothetical protein [Longimicrobiaceae bacterium]